MKEEEAIQHTGELPVELSEEEWGDVIYVDEECPGVFFVSTQSMETLDFKELYVVLDEAVPEIISPEVKAYGARGRGASVFENGVPGSGWPLVSFEIMRYGIKHGKMQKSTGCILHRPAAIEALPQRPRGTAPAAT